MSYSNAIIHGNFFIYFLGFIEQRTSDLFLGVVVFRIRRFVDQSNLNPSSPEKTSVPDTQCKMDSESNKKQILRNRLKLHQLILLLVWLPFDKSYSKTSLASIPLKLKFRQILLNFLLNRPRQVIRRLLNHIYQFHPKNLRWCRNPVKAKWPLLMYPSFQTNLST